MRNMFILYKVRVREDHSDKVTFDLKPDGTKEIISRGKWSRQRENYRAGYVFNVFQKQHGWA